MTKTSRQQKNLGATSCAWEHDIWADYWDTACGHAFTLTTDGPRENGMKFCPYCGRPLKAKCVALPVQSEIA